MCLCMSVIIKVVILLVSFKQSRPWLQLLIKGQDERQKFMFVLVRAPFNFEHVREAAYYTK